MQFTSLCLSVCSLICRGPAALLSACTSVPLGAGTRRPGRTEGDMGRGIVKWPPGQKQQTNSRDWRCLTEQHLERAFAEAVNKEPATCQGYRDAPGWEVTVQMWRSNPYHVPILAVPVMKW
ncbi:hypothetical protein BKA59DRAFT_139926 [Fusarium tricinctum]|uniref:Uncharacterized protein n=1 Tax=Fusarium tricinctum TaxID=61284 RepID=A0A8K0RZN8_9HYPO|nr:hypothetical protein BKA59DRAFT_139926 [Fusarium tricinctum]